ncbi:methylated-DNA--[protein]-cysteine S-methyltransferase [Saccharospirillum salsuginis]|uniref:Methylated-DNA--protein-cysteine methyltransferase n=1 Tax=Saccharospirillum salsuginis TaxID=418750 RepID=A0A918K2Q1_9GAMM|nr:methylated-DNA--[protein]-cysteine S-methyltransferase [Saccharospirillum salsuginis]GGX42061.1 hypothetical protein GCM10007392_06250 [Saccharospirillum salsuginis]
MTQSLTDTIVFDTPQGAFRIDALGGRIVQAAFCEEPARDSDVSILKVAEKQYLQYFDGQRTHFQLPLAPRGTAFQQRVWLALDRLDFAQTCTYAHIAQQLGQPTAARAVARAVASNPLAIVIPCHRVIGQNGRIGGYAWGSDRKAWLLKHERTVMGLDHPASGRITA